MIHIYVKLWIFEKRSGTSLSTTFLYEFSTKIFPILYSILWPNFIVWLALLLQILGNVHIALVSLPVDDIINFEIDCMSLSCHIRVSEWITLYSCLNVKELLAQNSCNIWSLSDSNGIQTHNHFVSKKTLNHLVKLAKWLSCVVSTHLHDAFDCMLLSCHVRVSEWIYTL